MNQTESLPPTILRTPLELDDYIKAFEEARLGDPNARLADFLPRGDRALYPDVLRELVRVDLELSWQGEHGKRLEDYAAEFPELFGDPGALQEIAFEEYRLRRLAGEDATPAEYAQRFGVNADEWPEELALAQQLSWADPRSLSHPGDSKEPATLMTAEVFPAARVIGEAASAYKQFLQKNDQSVAALDAWCVTLTNNRRGAEFFRAMHVTDPEAAGRLAQSLTAMPEVGTKFLGFQLIEALGKGAFGTVYLAEQGDLANRPVALKVATDILGESRTLAQLQHTNIVPIYSVHRADRFQAVCMPYFGRTTLADVLRQLDSGRSIPESGKLLVSTLNIRKLSTRRTDSSKSPEPASATPAAQPEPAPVSTSTPQDADATLILKKLESMSYVNAVLWMGTRLADGLAHAHERGILHRDLKPANVLLTDDGQPMLLDFNLSEDTKLRGSAAAASIGGTLPYMAPEHLQAFRGGSKCLDSRSDLYSLGIILYELLTGQRPFPSFQGTSPEVLDQMIRERHNPLPPAQAHNPAVTPAVDAILRHCLRPNPQERYRNARELYEDLDRQLQDLPLKHVAEPSWPERARKFARRHPRLTSITTVAAAAVVLCLGLTSAFAIQGMRLRRLEAREQYGAFQDEAGRAHHILYARTQSREDLQEGAQLCRAALGRYQVIDNPRWQELPAFQNLPRMERDKLQEDVGELLFLLSRGTERAAVDLPQTAAGREEQLQLAMTFNELAETRSNGVLGSAPLWGQRAHLATLLGDRKETERLLEKIKQAPDRGTRDLYLAAHGHAIDGNFRAALPLLETVIHREPQNYSAWAVLGDSHHALGHDADALACYSACIALRPTDSRAWHNRGLIYLKQRLYEAARSDFNEAIAGRPDFADAFIDRAVAHEGLQNYAAALEDLSTALKLGTPRTRVYFMRAMIKEKSGDAAGARRDMDEGLRLEPTDEVSWIARGLARQPRDPKGALADFNQALEINPRSVDALENKANVLSECLGRRDEAIKVLDRAVEFHPDFVPARAGRGVLLARAGKRDLAEADAKESLLRDTRAPNLYQVAGIYALNSRQKPEDRLQALHLLSQALRQGFGLDLVDQDPELDPLRNDPEFRRVVKAARDLQREVSAK